VAVQATVIAGGMDVEQAVHTLRQENEALEAAIEALSSGKAAAETRTLSDDSLARKGGFKVMQFGPTSISGEAGVDRGTGYRPPQTKSRTIVGGFFNS
jgi:hypothetical protein